MYYQIKFDGCFIQLKLHKLSVGKSTNTNQKSGGLVLTSCMRLLPLCGVMTLRSGLRLLTI